ncbi:MAG: FKBP-type peptidyl-prolyl cis-trans isomerase [Cryomorphaceae bacterium]
MQRIFVLTLLSSIFIVSSCTKNFRSTQLDEKIILQYISDNNLNAEPTGSGLYYVVDNYGNGDVPNIQSIVTVAYKGTLTDGTIFDQSGASGATFPLTHVIQGWQEGIPLFSEGGSGILLIPSALGYGNQAIGSIPANSVLIFEVTLLNVD